MAGQKTGSRVRADIAERTESAATRFSCFTVTELTSVSANTVTTKLHTRKCVCWFGQIIKCKQAKPEKK